MKPFSCLRPQNGQLLRRNAKSSGAAAPACDFSVEISAGFLYTMHLTESRRGRSVVSQNRYRYAGVNNTGQGFLFA